MLDVILRTDRLLWKNHKISFYIQTVINAIKKNSRLKRDEGHSRPGKGSRSQSLDALAASDGWENSPRDTAVQGGWPRICFSTDGAQKHSGASTLCIFSFYRNLSTKDFTYPPHPSSYIIKDPFFSDLTFPLNRCKTLLKPGSFFFKRKKNQLSTALLFTFPDTLTWCSVFSAYAVLTSDS